MSRRDRHLRLCAVLIVLNLCFIWGNSLMPAELSQAFSDSVKTLLEAVVQTERTALSSGGLIRKIAHFTEFTVLGMLLCWWDLLKKRKWHPLLPGVMAACMDETIQMFVPGRSPGLLDVGIDTCGVLTGIFLLQIGYVLMRRNQK